MVINVNYHANGGLAGATDYTYTLAPKGSRAPLLRLHRSGRVELFGQTTNLGWSQLVTAMLEDQRTPWQGHDNTREVTV